MKHAASCPPCAALNLARCMWFMDKWFTVSCRHLAPAVGVHTYVYVYKGTIRPKSKQGNITNMNISFSIENDKRAAQVRFKHMTYLL